MPEYTSMRSKAVYEGISRPLQVVFSELIKHADNSLIEGQRSDQRQAELFANGFSKLDGVTQKSNHQPVWCDIEERYVSRAVDWHR